MIALRRLTASVLMFSFLATLLHGPLRVIGRANDTTSDEEGLQFRLSQGVEQPEKKSATTPATASELSQSEIETVLKRLPPMKVDPTEEFQDLRKGHARLRRARVAWQQVRR